MSKEPKETLLEILRKYLEHLNSQYLNSVNTGKVLVLPECYSELKGTACACVVGILSVLPWS